MSEASPSPAAAPAPEPDPIALIAAKTLHGDVRDFLLHRLQHDHNPLPWNVRGEESQKATIEAANAAAETLVQRVVELVMSGGRRTVLATLKQAKLKDCIACEIQVPKTHEDRHALLDAVGDQVMLVLGGVDAFMGDRGKPKASPDQAPLFPDDDGDGNEEDGR